jgi:hypothetical protein
MLRCPSEAPVQVRRQAVAKVDVYGPAPGAVMTRSERLTTVVSGTGVKLHAAAVPAGRRWCSCLAIKNQARESFVNREHGARLVAFWPVD